MLEKQPITLERLDEHITFIHEAVKALQERVRFLENPGVLNSEETKDAKTIMADKLKTELEKQLNACKGKVKSVLFRAKFVEKKGLKTTGEIDMQNHVDIQEKNRIGRKLSDTIAANKSCILTLTATGIWADVKDKDPEYRARVSIKIR